MTAPQTDATADPQSVIAALQQRLEAVLAREVMLTEALTRRNSEYSERIEQQSATIDVLKAMSGSPDDTQPVFDLITRRAQELCNCKAAGIFGYDGQLVHIHSSYGVDAVVGGAPYLASYPRAPTHGTIVGRTILQKRVIHIRDLQAEPELLPIARDLGVRSILSIPLLRDDAVVGVFNVNSEEPGGFTDSQVALVWTFAEQALIAITSAETYRALQTRTSDLQETLEYQTATSDVLKVISRSAFDLQPVLATLLKTAARLCDAETAGMTSREGDTYRVVATFSNTPAFDTFIRGQSFTADRASVTGRTALAGHIVQIADLAADPEYAVTEAVTLGGVRTLLGVPLLRDGNAAGVIILGRFRVQPFTDRQIELVRTFADQAVIAMENARLITEQRDALERQTATAEVLQVINASPGNLAPVFDAMLEKAIRLCESAFGILSTYDGECFHTPASRGVTPALADFLHEPIRPRPGMALYRLVNGEDTVHVADITDNETYRLGTLGPKALADLGGARTVLLVALRKDGALLGAINIFRQEVRPFSDKQIALLQNFAVQAVIAMENARLIAEQREALEQQTATAEVLQVINSSPGDLAPVFDAVLEKAMRLCGAAFGSLYRYDGERFLSAAQRGVPLAYAAFRARHPPTMEQGGGPATLLKTRKPFHVLDMKAHETYGLGWPGVRAMVELGGVRTSLIVPLLKDDAVLGFISIYRQEVRAYSDKEIALLENFAAQAVIAMENARLLTEQREALEQQTAIAEVLEVINANPGNLAPVFDAILEKAARLCEAEMGTLWTYDGEYMHPAAMRGAPPSYAEFLKKGPHRPNWVQSRALRGERVIHTVGATEGEGYRSGDTLTLAGADLGGIRMILVVPLRKDEAALGTIAIYRQEVRPFTDKQITLLENFAAQAVIAMENARLLNEIRQRQEELRVTFENMGDGVALFDETRHLVASNQRFQRMLDVPDDVISSRPAFADYIRYLADRGEYGSDPEDHVQRLLAFGGQPTTFERTRPNGSVIEVRGNPVPGGGFVVIYSDITERKHNEEALRAARDAAEEASRTIEAAYRDLKAAQANLIQAEKMASLGQLTAGIAHEIKNPLNFVNNFAELSVDLLGELKDAIAPAETALTEKQRAEVEEVSVMLTSNLEKITEHGKRADGIVKAMLEHSRGSSGDRRMVDLNALIDDALNLAYHGARAQDQSFNITLERDFSAGIAPIEVNPQDITRVFLNLFANGFYAVTRRGRNGGDAGFVPTLKVTTRGAGDAVEIRVRDNGTGIPADIRDKLFQPFFTTKPTGEGTGLGLSITYDIVTQQHGGSITVDSKVGEYSEFTMRLPRNP